MVLGVTEISAIVAAAGVLVGVVYYILEIRHQTRTRDTELVTRLHSTFSRNEFQQELQRSIEVLQSEADFSDIRQKYGGVIATESSLFFEELGSAAQKTD